MKKDFKSRLMPNIKFKINGDISKCSDVFDTKMLEYGLFHAITDINGAKIFHIPSVLFDSCIYKEVSIYEAIPELIPDGMRYNKELDKLVPDVIEDFKPKKQSVVDWAKENINPNIVAFDDVEINKDEHPSKIKVESKKIVDITPEDKEILTALRQCGKSYLQIINLIKNTDSFKKHNGGDGNDYYDLPLNALQLQDLIEFKNMNANIKDIFKACWRKGDKKGVDEIYDVEKMVYYSLREAGKVLNTKDYISIATRIMGKQNVK